MVCSLKRPPRWAEDGKIVTAGLKITADEIKQAYNSPQPYATALVFRACLQALL